MSDTDHLPAGIEFNALSDAGLPVRPTPNSLHTPTLSPVSSENTAMRGEPQQPSASQQLAAALRNEPMDCEEAEPTEARTPRRAVSPEDPTDAEVEAHKLSGHAVFRSWCRHCVRGKRCEGHHFRTHPPDSAVPVISWDYCYLSSSADSSETQSELESPVLS